MSERVFLVSRAGVGGGERFCEGKVLWSAVPGDGFDRAEEEGPAGAANELDGSGNEEGPGEVAGALNDEAGDDGDHGAGKTAKAILEADPASGGGGSGEALRDGPNVGRGHAEEAHGREQEVDAGRRARVGAEREKDGDAEGATGSRGFANRGRRSASKNPAVGEPTRENRKRCAQQISGATDFGHALHGEVLLAHQVVGHPGEQEEVDVVAAPEA